MASKHTAMSSAQSAGGAATPATPGTALSSSTPASGTTTPGAKAARSRRLSQKPGRRRKPQEFRTPSGRRILVSLPEDAAALRDKYAGVLRENGNEDDSPQIEVVVHGSPEHKQYLQESRDHHETQRERLKDKYGAELLEEWDRVNADLHHVSTELEKLADHSASLGHNFSKFGFDATLRTFGDDEGHGGGHGTAHGSSGTTANNSRRGSIASGGDNGSGDEDDSEGDGGVPKWHNQGSGTTMQIFKRPMVKQYFHKGLLWRASEETSVQSFELFFDLLYVGIIAINGDHAAESADGFELLRFLVTFCMSWKIWSDVTQLVSWFSTSDVLQRVEILFLYSCLLAVTANMVQTFYGWPSHREASPDTGEETATATEAVMMVVRSVLYRRAEEGGEEGESHLGDTYPALVAYYVTARLFMALYCFVTGLLVPLVQGTMYLQTAIMTAGAALWIASIHLPMPVRLACVFVALAFDLFSGSFIVGLFRFARSRSETNRFARYVMTRLFDFYPAINIEHKVERTNAFIALVLGYSVVGVLYQNTRGYGLDAFLGKAVLGLVQAFIFSWIYFDIDGDNIHVHAIRWRAESAYIWQYAHLIFTLAFILSSAALTRLVVATDCANADATHLTETYQERSSPTVTLGLRLYYSTGLGISLFALTAIALCHKHKMAPTARLPKAVRLGNRCAVAAVFCALPAAQWLTSMQLVSIATGLITWVLVVEIYGQSCTGDSLFELRGPCGYTARCSQKRLTRALENAQEEENARGNAAGRPDEEVGRQPNLDVNVLSQGQKHGAAFIE